MPVPVPDGYDLTDPDIYAEKGAARSLARLRRSAPVFWNAQTVEESSFDDGGLWVLSRACGRQGGVVCSRGLVERGEHRDREIRRRNRRLSEREIQKRMMLEWMSREHTRVRSASCLGRRSHPRVGRTGGSAAEVGERDSARCSGQGHRGFRDRHRM